jgi:hypothetical protein
MGIEVVDTTAPINRAGSISVCHVPGEMQTDTSLPLYWLQEGEPYTGKFGHVAISPVLPTNLTLMSRIPNYVTWEASKGAYVVGRMLKPTPPRYFHCSMLGYEQTPFGIAAPWSHAVVSENWPASTSSAEYFAIPYGDDPTSEYTSDWNWETKAGKGFDSGFQPFVIMLSGLAATSTFRVTLRTYVEYFPDITDEAVIGNALKASPYDPRALEMYQASSRNIPTAVPVGMNPNGEWWQICLRAMKAGIKAAGPGMMAGFGASPLATAIASAVVPQVAKAIRQRVSNPSPKGKGKKKGPQQRPKGGQNKR